VGPTWHGAEAGRVGHVRRTQSVSAEGEAVVVLGVHIRFLI
jgi:hypothetical protein